MTSRQIRDRLHKELLTNMALRVHDTPNGDVFDVAGRGELHLGILLDLYLRDAAAALEHYDRYLALTQGGDAAVTRWVADLKNRKTPPALLTKKEG